MQKLYLVETLVVSLSNRKYRKEDFKNQPGAKSHQSLDGVLTLKSEAAMGHNQKETT